MIEIEKTLVSEDIFDELFTCNISACKGACCIEGDAGAPLDEDETDKLDEILDTVLPYLPEEGKQAIEQQGSFVVGHDGEYETPLVKGKECAYTVFDKQGIAQRGLDLACIDGKHDFQKPLSCHLYPIRITKVVEHEALNYHKWDICSDACTLGKELKQPVYKFVKGPLIRKFGEEYFTHLENCHELWEKEFRYKK